MEDNTRSEMEIRHPEVVLPPIRDIFRPPPPLVSSSVPQGSRNQPIEIDEDADDPSERQQQEPDGSISIPQLLGRQQEEQVESQRTPNDKSISLRNLTCVICMDKPTDLTAASCGMYNVPIFLSLMLTIVNE